MRGKAKFGAEVEFQKQLPEGSYLWEVAQAQLQDTKNRSGVYILLACEVLEAADPKYVGLLHYAPFSCRTKELIATAREKFIEMGATEALLDPFHGPDDLVGLVFRADIASARSADGMIFYHLENIVAEGASD